MELTWKFNIASEQNILGTIIKRNDLLCDVIDILDPNDFYNDKHKYIYATAVKLYKNNMAIDITSLANEFKDRLPEVGGVTYLSELYSSTIASKNAIKTHALIVKEKSNKRNLKAILEKTLNEIELDNKKAEELINILQSETINVAASENIHMLSDSEIMERTLNLIQDNYNRGGNIVGLNTGLKKLDLALNGLQKQKLYVIAGRPGMCKSAFALNIQHNISDKRAAYFSLEMSEEELGLRRLAMTSYIDSGLLERGAINETEWQKVAMASSKISNGKGVTNTKPSISVNQIRSQCKKMQLQGDIDALIIDHLTLINTKGMGDSLREQITNICINLKTIAKEFNIPVILLAQLSRACEARGDKRPMLSDLKESGGIEENADVVMLLYRDEYYNKETEEKNIVEVDIAKQRGGKTGRIKFAWLPQYQKVADLDVRR